MAMRVAVNGDNYQRMFGSYKGMPQCNDQRLRERYPVGARLALLSCNIGVVAAARRNQLQRCHVHFRARMPLKGIGRYVAQIT